MGGWESPAVPQPMGRSGPDTDPRNLGGMKFPAASVIRSLCREGVLVALPGLGRDYPILAGSGTNRLTVET